MSTSTRTYRERLKEKPLLESSSKEAETIPDTTSAFSPALTDLQTILAHDSAGTSFQSVVMTAVKIVERALCVEQRVVQAALSLGQREKVTEMVKTTEAAAELLRSTLSARGPSLNQLCGERPTVDATERASWWYMLAEAVEVLDDSVEQLVSLSNAQAKDSLARALSDCVAQLLRRHHNTLLVEAEQWMPA